MTRKRLFVDMDGTLSQFNKVYMYLEALFEKGFFLDQPPELNLIEALRFIIANHPEVEVFVTPAVVDSEYCKAEKNAWLDKYLPELDNDHRIFYDVNHDLNDYIPSGLTDRDYVLDDYNRNLNTVLEHESNAIKAVNDLNDTYVLESPKPYAWLGPIIRVDQDPVIITGDILEHMGFDRDVDRECDALNIIPIYSSDPTSNEIIALTTEDPYYLTVNIESEPLDIHDSCCASFGDALKYVMAKRKPDLLLEADFRAFHITNSTGDESLLLPGWQVTGLSFNLDLTPRQMTGVVSDHVMDLIKQELHNASIPIFGRIEWCTKDNIKLGRFYRNPLELAIVYHNLQSDHRITWLDLDRYIKTPLSENMDIEKDTDPHEWVMTDDDCLQHRKLIGNRDANDSFELCQIVSTSPDTYAVCCGSISNLENYPKDELLDYLNYFGFESFEQFLENGGRTSEGKINYGLIAEMIFESDFTDYITSATNLTYDQAIDEIYAITGNEEVLSHKDLSLPSLSDLLFDAKNITNPDIDKDTDITHNHEKE